MRPRCAACRFAREIALKRKEQALGAILGLFLARIAVSQWVACRFPPIVRLCFARLPADP